MGFTTPSYSLSDLFARTERGELQVPDFQRDYVWDIDRVRTLVTSVLRGYPIGSLLALDTRNVEVRFKSRAIHGLPAADVSPGLVLLDGQQRLTSLYHALCGDGVVPARDFLGREIKRRFFVDVVKASSADPMPVEAVFPVDDQGRVASHFGPQIPGGITSREDMVAAGVMPVSELLRPESVDLLFDMVVAAEGEATGRREAVKAFHFRVMGPLPAYTVPVIRVDRTTSLTGIGQIFAHANSAGVQMDVFELLTSLFAVQDPGFSLVGSWEKVKKGLREYPVLDGIGRIEFLRAMSLVVTSRTGGAVGHRGDILNLSVEDYQASVDELGRAFTAAAHFLQKRCFFSRDQVPYPAQIVSLAAILARLEESGRDLDQRGTDRLNQWFWCGMFGELYGGLAPTIRSGGDVDEVTPWVLGQREEWPRSVADAQFAQSRLLTADATSGVFRGMYALLMGRGARDWRTGQEFTAADYRRLEVRFNKIFPAAYCEMHNVAPLLAESVLNRTPMGIRTKILIESNSPKRYLPRLQSKSIMEDAEFDAMLAQHHTDPALLFASEHEAFFRDRLQRFTEIIEYSMGKQVSHDLDGSEDTIGLLSGAPMQADATKRQGSDEGKAAQRAGETAQDVAGHGG
ncbi:GmrSD restriction endonuclease domain-containing protein [Corynebacterium mayonis]|uniref:GmrSD restriction endonuclease domain-containing protein n=1 Tax=Corynebacterium mayonis TaxID=3062461 RepID=UPI0031403FF7